MQALDIQLTKVDQLGLLMAQIAELQEQADAIKDELKNAGEGHIYGNLYKACVSLSQRKVVDHKAIFEQANVPQSLIDANTKTTAVITLKLTSRS